MDRLGRTRLALLLGGAIAAGPAGARAQQAFAPPAGPVAAPAGAPIVAPMAEPSGTPIVGPPGAATVGPPGTAPPDAAPETPILPPQVQVVRFSAPEGVRLEILGPPTEPVPTGDGRGLATVGLRVGVGYRLRLSNLPNREGAELYPVIEVVGHLHRPPGIDPGKYPIRVVFRMDDIEDAVDRGRLVTHIVYLEDPDQALPLSLPKDEIPSATLTPSEEPLRVASALGRVMAIVRVGGRTPTPEEMLAISTMGAGSAPCPFAGPGGGRCPLTCAPIRGAAPPAGRPWLPKDEFLCDGGDRGVKAGISGGGVTGVDPRDALIRFQRPTLDQLRPEFDRLKARRDAGEISETTFDIEARRLYRAAEGDRSPRLLPTNVVCLYAPRFAEVRSVIGLNEDLIVQTLAGAENSQRQEMGALAIGPLPMTQNEAAVLNRHRMRPSVAINRQLVGGTSEVRILASADAVVGLGGASQRQTPQIARVQQKAGALRNRVKLDGIKTAESAVVTGLVQGVRQEVMSWKPQEVAGSEEMPSRPGLAVVKRVSASEAEPGDVVTFVIQYRNMGNAAIASVSVIDSLLPRLEYVPGSARGPAGTVFTASENPAGAFELRWDLPGTLAPGAEGMVSFQTRVR